MFNSITLNRYSIQLFPLILPHKKHGELSQNKYNTSKLDNTSETSPNTEDVKTKL